MEKFLFFFITLFVVKIEGKSQNKILAPTFHPNDVCLSGRFTANCDLYDSVEVRLWKDYILYTAGSELFSAKVKSGQFHLSLPAIEHPGFITIRLYGPTGSKATGSYIIESGDSLFLTINQTSNDTDLGLDFFGKGSPKFDCIKALELDKKQFDRQRSNRPGLYEYDSAGQLYKIHISAINSMLLTLNQYRTLLNYEVYKLIQAEYIDIPEYWQGQLLHYFIMAGDNEIREKAIQNYINYNFPVDTTDSEILARSSRFLDYLVMRAKADVKFENRKINTVNTFKCVYEKLKENYKGILLEKVLVHHLLDPGNRGIETKSPSTFYECIGDAYHIFETQNSILKKTIDEQIYSNNKGTLAFEFSLSDTSGNLINLRDFRGKVVLMDMWFTGCTGCAHFAKTFEDIYPNFKDDPRFAVVSICTDGDKKTWLKSLYSGKYTRVEYVNLYTNGMDFEHPITKHYNLVGLPFILLIDREGKIFTRIGSGVDEATIKNLIQQALENR